MLSNFQSPYYMPVPYMVLLPHTYLTLFFKCPMHLDVKVTFRVLIYEIYRRVKIPVSP